MKRRGSGVLSFPLSLIFFQWQGRHAPLTPDPSPPFRGRGEDFVFLSCIGKRIAPLAPGRGEGPGVRGEDHLGAAVLGHG